MSRSGYSNDDYSIPFGLYRNSVNRAINGKRGQAFLRELAKAMDDMPERKLIRNCLIDDDGGCCTMGVICKSRGLTFRRVMADCPDYVGGLLGISTSMAAEISFWNDDDCGCHPTETGEQRWVRMRKWVSENLIEEDKNEN